MLGGEFANDVEFDGGVRRHYPPPADWSA
jgi:hypothetical protein